MKNKRKIFIILLIVAIIIFYVFINELIPIIKEKDYKNRVFNEMQEKSDIVIRGIVGIIPKNNKNGLSSYN